MVQFEGSFSIAPSSTSGASPSKTKASTSSTNSNALTPRIRIVYGTVIYLSPFMTPVNLSPSIVIEESYLTQRAYKVQSSVISSPGCTKRPLSFNSVDINQSHALRKSAITFQVGIGSVHQPINLFPRRVAFGNCVMTAFFKGASKSSLIPLMNVSWLTSTFPPCGSNLTVQSYRVISTGL